MSTPNQSTTESWVTMNQAAEALGVSRDTIRRMIKRGQLEAVKLGPKLVRVNIATAIDHATNIGAPR